MVPRTRRRGHATVSDDRMVIGPPQVAPTAFVHSRASVCRSIIGAGALLVEGVVIPPGALVLGVPGKVVRPTTDEQRAGIARSAMNYQRLADAHSDGTVRYHRDL